VIDVRTANGDQTGGSSELEGIRFQLADVPPNPEARSGAWSAVPLASGP
jgi:hypothetical protein